MLDPGFWMLVKKARSQFPYFIAAEGVDRPASTRPVRARASTMECRHLGSGIQHL